jgi:hypothetical protein
MPDLSHSLQGRDLGHLQIVAEKWEVEISALDARQASDDLLSKLLAPSSIKTVVSSLPSEAKAALEDLASHGGKLPWSLFTRRYGEVREMGSGRRDRDQPHLNPASTAEALWYCALVARAFFDTPKGPTEFAYIPDDFLPHLLFSQFKESSPPGRPASPIEHTQPVPADDRILDHACSLLAAQRLGLSEEASEKVAAPWKELKTHLPYPLTPTALRCLLFSAGLISENGMPIPEPVRGFLEAARGEALAVLNRTWLESRNFNELRLIPHLKVEGEWENDPLLARRAILGFMGAIPAGKWWSLPSFVSQIQQSDPDFQRTAGDYDSWFIRQVNGAGEGDFLRGVEQWDAVDGELIRFTVCGPMHWLGLVDLAWTKGVEKGGPAAFRLSRFSQSLLEGRAPKGLLQEDKTATAGSDARLRIPRLAPRAARYQLARFCSWESESEEIYHYRITPASLARARLQGLNVQHLSTLLRRHVPALPPGLIKALERWEQRGVEARFEKLVVLRLSSPEMLQSLRKSRAARFLGDPLGPTTVIVRPGAWEKVLAALAEIGILGEANLEE